MAETKYDQERNRAAKLRNLVDQLQEIVVNRPDLFPLGISGAEIVKILTERERGKIEELKALLQGEPTGAGIDSVIRRLEAENRQRRTGENDQRLKDKLKEKQDLKTESLPQTPSLTPQTVREALDRYFEPSLEQGVFDIKEQFAPLRKSVIEEQARTGRRGLPVSGRNLRQVDTNIARGIAKLIALLSAEKGRQTTNLMQALERLKESGRQFDIGQAFDEKAFNESLQFQKDKLAKEISLGIEAIKQGQISADRPSDAYKPGKLDYLNTAFQGANTAIKGYDVYKSRNKRNYNNNYSNGSYYS